METLKTILGLLILLNIAPLIASSIGAIDKQGFQKIYLITLAIELSLILFIGVIILGVYLIGESNT